MSGKAQAALGIFESQVGSSDGHSDWMTIDQDRINAFADATLDHQFIHIDPEKSAQLSPYKTTIAHGFLTLSLLVHLTSQIAPRDPKAYDGVVMAVNYGLDKVRFPAPVPVGSRIRAERTLLGAELKGDNTIQLKAQVTIECEGSDKPVCVAETLMRLIYA